MNNKINKLKAKLSIFFSNTYGVIFAVIRGKRIVSISEAYMDYIDGYLFSTTGANFGFEDTIPLYGEHSFKSWASRNNYHIVLTSDINFEKEQEDFINVKWSIFDKYLLKIKRKFTA